jgi:hypothetical protein
MSDEWPEEGSPTGAIGTITRPAGQPATGPAAPGRTRPPSPRPSRPRHPHRPHREPKGAPPSNRGASPRVEGRAGAWTEERPSEARERRGKTPGAERPETSGNSRVPFFLMLCGLLGGALICALVISTTLAAGSFQITRLQQANASLAKQRQLLQEQVATGQSAQVIQVRARQLGMRPVGEVRFLNLKNGKVETDAGSGAVEDIHVPGYTP